jgi:hypothetical protein
MIHGCECYLDSQFATKISEVRVAELFSIVDYDIGWDCEATDNSLLDETDGLSPML